MSRGKKKWDEASKAKRKKKWLLNEQKKAAACRAKYGPTGKPAPVVVRSVESGEVSQVVDQWHFQPPPGRYSPRLDELARAAGFDSYEAYLRSPYWRSIRALVLKRDRGRCVRCQSPRRLTIHHASYDHIGDEWLGLLKTFCWWCHTSIHK